MKNLQNYTSGWLNDFNCYSLCPVGLSGEAGNMNAKTGKLFPSVLKQWINAESYILDQIFHFMKVACIRSECLQGHTSIKVLIL